jgi:2-oxoisovalerate dehydrogenase E1 component alpha subunit
MAITERNHLQHIQATHDVHVIKNGLIDIPMLQLLDAQGNLLSQELNLWDEQTALRIFKSMHYIRILDERMVSAQRQGRISFYLACTGEEASVIASTAALADADMVMTQYREQGVLAYRGYRTEQFMNQLLSNALDPNKGRQMPIHYGDKALNFMTVSSPLGTQIPQAAGYAYGQKMAGQPAITMCYFGEGAASEGDFHAGLNMAAVLHCPVIFFCRNNGYAISTPANEQFAGDGIASRGIGYGVNTIRVDGNDPLAVYLATQKAREIALTENCPVLIEAMTYRLAAHSTSDDPASYRAKSEEQEWQLKDPILRMQRHLEQQGWFDQTQIDDYCAAQRAEILQALKTAEIQPKIGISEIVTDVYHDVPAHLARQRDELMAHINRHPEYYPATKMSVKQMTAKDKE